MRKHFAMILERRRENNNQLKAFLGEQYFILQAFNEEEALTGILRARDYIEVILLDHAFLLMMDENKTMQQVKEKVFAHGIPIISTMADYDLQTAAAAIQAGAAEILVRPYEETLLQQRVHNIVLQRGLKRAKQYDPLTGIYNKETFYEKVEELITENPQNNYTVLCLDIDRFKVINDLLGSQEGDKLLQFVGDHLKVGTVEAGGVTGRITADVFACCYPNIENHCQMIAEQISYMLKEYPLHMEIIASVGFYHVDDRTLPTSRMCDRAILALKSVKGNYLRNYAVYNAELRNDLIWTQEIVNDMEGALRNEEFKVYLQPKCDMDTGRIIGAEALVRWLHPIKGLIPPDEFIPIFEENKFVLNLDSYVWEEICILIRDWIDAGNTPIPISANVSRVNLYMDGLYERLVLLVDKYKIDPRLLELEITESAYADDIEYLAEVVDRLRAYGFTILMDDFGSGYSSLNMLKDISIDVLKIDMRFLTGESDGHDKGGDIIESVVQMANWLNLLVIAEGVETKEQVDFLLSINCHYAQGYYYYKPMPSDKFKTLILQEGAADYRGMRRKLGETFSLQELMHQDAMSNAVLQNIIGGVAFYEYYQGNLELIRANDGYYREIGYSKEELPDYAKHISETIYEEDRPAFERMIRETEKGHESGVEAIFRRRRLNGKLLWVRMKLFYLGENKERKLFYGAVRNVTEEKEAEISCGS